MSDEIDDYKSNLIVRFLTSPQLFEFDTEDKRAESVFQLYGQSFDSVKKYIDNIAFMRHVSYDSINNIPDVLLKNLSQNLGLDTVNLFDEKSLNDILYTRQDSNYSGVAVGKNLVESEYEFYRRILINLAQLYKSKGTRKALEFFLKFLGAPEPMIKIDEYVYAITSVPTEATTLVTIGDITDLKVNFDLYNYINGIETGVIVTDIITGGTFPSYVTGVTNSITATTTTTLTREDYPIDENGVPKGATSSDGSVFFQQGSGWYDVTLQHRSPLVIDYENSVYTGRTRYTKTMNKPYTYGEDYFDSFRTFQGLDYGYELKSRIDNKKVSVVNDSDVLTLNRKNLSVYLSPSQTIEYDIWRQSSNLELTFGTMSPQTGITFAEFLNTALKNALKNSNTMRFDRGYIGLEKIYSDYINSTGFTPFEYTTLIEYIKKMSPYWVKVIEQFVPATTLWTGGVLIKNTVFNRSKYRYYKPNYGGNFEYDCKQKN